MKEIAKYSGCFVCGDDNQIGLGARFFFDNQKALTSINAERQFEGYRDIYHGGIIATLLDEVMIKALLGQDIVAMTVELTVRFHKPVEIGQRLDFEGWLGNHRGRLYLTEGTVKTAEGETVADATGKYIEVKKDMKTKLLRSLER